MAHASLRWEGLGQVDARPGDALADVADQVVLAWLSDDEAVCADGAEQSAVLLGFSASFGDDSPDPGDHPR
jgi:hypothetical protein